jgi:hypothetical protein
MITNAPLAFGFGTPFQAQIDFLRQKLRLPTERWDDILSAANDRAFIVAGAAKADLLQDLHDAVIRGAADGGGERAFLKDFRAIVAKHGWSGWRGEGTPAGEAWRARIIFQTNMSTSYWAGRYKQMTDPEVLKLHPYWRYIHAEGILHPRPQHLAWHGLTLLATDPFWKTHFPPNGWMCHCRITSVSQAEGERSAKAGLGEPPAGWDAINAKTGEQIGIDRSFGYAPGASVKKPLQELIDSKLISLDAPIGARMWEAMKPFLQQERKAAYKDWLSEVLADPVKRGRTQVVGTISSQLLDSLSAIDITPSTAEIAVNDSVVIGKKAIRHEAAGDALSSQEWLQVPAILASPEQVLFDTRSGHLLYIAASSDQSHVKLAIEFDFLQKKTKGKINLIVSAYKAEIKDILGAIAGGIYKVMK